MNRMLFPPREIVVDLRFELLGLGIERVVDQEFGLQVTKFKEDELARPAAAASTVLIADFASDPDTAEQRIAHLLSRGRGFRLLVMMLAPWDDVAIRFVRAGARGILYPDATTSELVEAIYAVAGPRTYLPASLRDALAERYVSKADVAVEALTQRELEFVRGLSVGATTSELACAMNIGVKTAETHRANALRKLGARNNVELTRAALRHGLVAL